MPLASVVALRLMTAPLASVPLSVTVTPAMPFSPAWRTPSLLLSSQTLPDRLPARSPKLLPLAPASGRLGMVMALLTLLLPVALPAFVLPSA